MLHFRFCDAWFELRKRQVKIVLGHEDLNVSFKCHLREVVVWGDGIRVIARLFFVQKGCIAVQWTGSMGGGMNLLMVLSTCSACRDIAISIASEQRA